MEDELGGKIKAEFVALRPKTCIYLTDDNDENENAKYHQKSVIERKLKFQRCLEAAQLENKINQLEKNKFNVDNL